MQHHAYNSQYWIVQLKFVKRVSLMLSGLHTIMLLKMSRMSLKVWEWGPGDSDGWRRVSARERRNQHSGTQVLTSKKAFLCGRASDNGMLHAAFSCHFRQVYLCSSSMGPNVNNKNAETRHFCLNVYSELRYRWRKPRSPPGETWDLVRSLVTL